MHTGLLLYLLLVGSMTSPATQQADDAKKQVGPQDISIWNHCDRTTEFYLQNEGSDWRPFKLPPDQIGVYSDATKIKVITNRPDKSQTDAEYDLEKGKRYELYWNQEGERYDVATVQPRR